MNIFEARMNELYAQIERHAGLYYDHDSPEISDSEYDALVRELHELEREHPQFTRKDFLTHRVGGSPSELFAPVKHDVPMLSLDNVFSHDELAKFLGRLNVESGFTCEMKIDGLAVSLVYQDGVLVRGATRGNGQVGEDVTQNLMLIDSIPKKLTNAPEGMLEVRGEVLMSLSRFNALNEASLKNGDKPFANPRNAAAGTLRQKNSKLIAERGLDIFLYYLVDAQAQGVTRQIDSLAWMSEHGLPVQPAFEYCATLESVNGFIDRWQSERYTLGYVTDGVVVKLDDLTQWAAIGATSHAPRWAVAFKYPSLEARTRLRDIEVSVGRTGVLTPVAILEPVVISGSTVQRATLHNADYITKRDIRVGDIVYVSKAGDVIPHVDRADESSRTGDEQVFTMPERCPSCNSELVRRPRRIVDRQRVITEVAFTCPNKSCPAQLERGLMFFASRSAMDIRGIGKSLASRLVYTGKVRKLTDIYRLSHDEWLSVIESEKITQKILDELEASKSRPLASFIAGIGIPNVEKVLAGKLAEYFGNIDALESASLTDIIRALNPQLESTAKFVFEYLSDGANIAAISEKLSEVSGFKSGTKKLLAYGLSSIPAVTPLQARRIASRFGSLEAVIDASREEIFDALNQDTERIIANSIHTFFQDDANIKLMDEFKALGLNLSSSSGTLRAPSTSRPRRGPAQPSEIREDRFKGKVFVFTGTLSSMTRNEAGERVMELGGQFSNTITLKTSYLVAGEKSGSKLTKAEKLGIKILTEQEFLSMINA